jgi:hypothetical protein
MDFGPLAGEAECSGCKAGATVAWIVLDQASSMSALGRGDGQPPKQLWDAVVAEDWVSVRREWDRWMWPQLRELDRTGKDWRALLMTLLRRTVQSLKDAGVSGPVPSETDAPLGEDALMGVWLPWIRKGIASVKDVAQQNEWAGFVETLPVELQALALEHPERQAEVAAYVFEIALLLRSLDDDGGA